MKQGELEQLITNLWTFLKDHLPLINTHGAEFISGDHWEKFVPASARQVLLSLSADQLVNLPLVSTQDGEVTGNIDGSVLKEEDTNVQWLEEFLATAAQYHIDKSCILHSLNEVLKIPGDGQRFRHSLISEAMCQKKRHEVAVMSDTIVDLCSKYGADVVVDIGSGKGYLSTELARHHNMAVLGLDSQQGNTHGATQRDTRLGQRWAGLARRKESKGHKVRVIDGRDQGERLSAETETNSDISSKTQQSDTKLSEISHRLGSDTSNLGSKVQDVSHRSHSNMPEISTEAHIESEHTKSVPGVYVPVTVFVQPDMNVRDIIATEAPQLCRSSPSEAKLFVAGLHTCGSLAVSSLRLFLTDPGVVGMCCVGCCYQLMEECTSKSECSESEGHFPLSILAKKKGIHLGRNARNLASQSVHRIHSSRQLQGGDFLWRALLDVLLQSLNLPVPERIIGMRGLVKRCNSFYDYAVAAFKKLGLPTEELTEEKVATLELRHAATQQQMVAFFQLKLCLAPVVETLILADRYLHLLEQDCVAEAYLVQLFDPVTSPRCCALIARRKPETIST